MRSGSQKPSTANPAACGALRPSGAAASQAATCSAKNSRYSAHSAPTATLAVTTGSFCSGRSRAQKRSAGQGGVCRCKLPATSPYSHAPTGSESTNASAVGSRLPPSTQPNIHCIRWRPTAAKLASAAASSGQAAAHSPSVTATVSAATAACRSRNRRYSSARTPAASAAIRLKKLPNGSVMSPASASRKQRLPLCPCASMPQRASTYHTANKCHTSTCHPARAGCSPYAHSAADSVNQHAAHSPASGVCRRPSARASTSTAAIKAAAKAGTCHPAKPLYKRMPRVYR